MTWSGDAAAVEPGGNADWSQWRLWALLRSMQGVSSHLMDQGCATFWLHGCCELPTRTIQNSMPYGFCEFHA